MKSFPGKLALQQRVLPEYRIPFFDTLAERCTDGLALFAGQPRPIEAIKTSTALEHAKLTTANNIHLFGGSAYLCWQSNLIEWLTETQPDGLIIEANPRYPNSPNAIRWMKARGKPVLGWALGAPTITGSLSNLRTQARLRLLSQLDGIVAYSEQGAAEYRALGLAPERVFVAHNAVMPPASNPPPKRPATFTGQPKILFVGRLQTRKRLDNLLLACQNLPPDLQPELTIVGDGPARNDYEIFAKEIYPSAIFVGAKHDHELTPYFEQADLFVLPGTGGLAIQQAMSHGLPVIAAQGDGTQNDLVQPDAGWLVTPNSISALSETLATALANPTKLRKMGQRAYQITKSEINIESMADKFVHALGTIAQLS